MVPELVRRQAEIRNGVKFRPSLSQMVAQFRSTFDVWAGDRAFLELIGCLRKGSPEFDAWWDDHDIRPIVSGRKCLHHPSGERCYEYATFQANDDPALKLVIYTLVDHELRGTQIPQHLD